MYMYIYIMYIWYMRIPYVHSALFVRDAISRHCTLVHVASHSRSRDKTSKTERLNSHAGEPTQLGLENSEEMGGTI